MTLPSEKRLKVLISAYACEHGKGSEPEVGWQWSLQMARFHDVTVLTRENNRQNIEAAIASVPSGTDVPKFIYFDGDPLLLWMKKRFKITRLYYIWWQRNARKLIGEICEKEHFDILHHVTIAGYRYITAIWGHGVTSVWGPVGGMESIYWRLLPFSHARELVSELGRNFGNMIQSAPTAVFPSRSRRSSLTLVSTKETQKCLDDWDLPSVLMPTIGLTMSDFPERQVYDTSSTRPLRLLFVGQLIWLKGVDLAIEALALSNTDATLHFIGGGPFKKSAEELANRLGIGDRLTFSKHIPRSQVLEEIRGYDVFLFPSLHDSGGFAVLEAMASGLPVICLDVGGPAISVTDGCGFRIPLEKRTCVIRNLSEKIRHYSEYRIDIESHGRNARTRIENHYDWELKGREMNALYQNLKKAATPPSHP